MILAADWTTISSLATAGGTLVLAVATFSSVRSANRAARTAERAFEVELRPILFPSRLEDPPQKLRWGDDHWANVGGGRGVVEEVDGSIYMAMSLRNVGSGNAVIHGWRVEPPPEFSDGGSVMSMPSVDDFRPQLRDLFVPSGDISFWQAAIRDRSDRLHPMLHHVVEAREAIQVDVLYGDFEGGQRAISRFLLYPRGDADDKHVDRLCTVVRHWNLDRPDPR